MCNKCKKVESLKQLDQLVLGYAPQIQALFEYYGIQVPVSMQSVADASLVFGDEFKQDLYLATIAPQNGPYEGALLNYEGQQFQDAGERKTFIDWMGVVTDLLTEVDGPVLPEDKKTESPEKKPQPEKGYGLTSDIILIIAIVALIILLILVFK